MTTEANRIRDFVAAIQSDCKEAFLPAEAGLNAPGQPVIALALVKGTRGYIERVAHQVNGCYYNGWYDACAVMVRRLLETLIIETFESHKIASKIKDGNGDFYFLSELIRLTLAEPSWNLTRNSKRALTKLKDIGDKSAHSRRYHAVRSDLDKLLLEIRVVVQELIYLAGLK
ncbi:MAG: hypothetical protein WB930_05605 [Syntrophobacteraceae bacterium]